MFIEMTLFNWNTKQIKVLGEGSFGKVILARDKFDNSKVVIKHVNLDNMDEKYRDYIIQEGNILQKLQHKNIISF